MKLKEKIKRFLTLDVHGHEGFTLVELIIVIAILAILSSVAVVGYSSYVTKANKQADLTMIAEIENVLTLAGYNGDLGTEGGGYLILTATGDVEGVEAGSNLEKVLIDAFGTNYKSVLKLKYTEWGNNGLHYGLYDPVSVYNSTYYGVADQLMSQVEKITGAAANIINNVAGREAMIGVFGSDLLIEAADASLGMELTEEDLQKMDETEFSNLLVFAAAFDVGLAGADEDYEESAASGLVMDFAKYNGFASTEAGKTVKDANGKTFADHYAEFVTAINKDDADVTAVKNAYNAIDAAASSYPEFATYTAEGGQSETDMAAFNAMMFGVTGAATANGDLKNQLGDPNFFSSGAGSELFNTYIGSVEAAVGLGTDFEAIMNKLDNMDNYAVAIFYTVNGNTVVIGNSLP